jgi:bis(5'-nucleosidyl)-tetraphosphatase
LIIIRLKSQKIVEMHITKVNKNTAETSAGVIPILHRKKEVLYLLVQHRGGHWSFPKGRAEEGETEIETARRELKEETGITEVELSSEPVFVDTYECKKDGVLVAKTVNYYLGKVASDSAIKIQEEEIKDFAWLSFEKTLDRITFKSTKQILEQAVKCI